MHLKNLTLKGFKSFAERTSMDFEPGVTVVVGPNGSGKSNVVDAIAWVLGVQAPSAVRSAKMDDVIFAGTVDKPALGRAEVSLTIDNHSRMLPVEFSEVKITRTLFRNGESRYAINGAPCRLLDITELLAGGGVGRHQHIVVSQGQIDSVLNARPEDRRAIIDEVAGVAVYRRRKERAEKRLADSEGDLTRETDLLREVRRRLRPLRKQAEAARRHGDLLAELSALRIHLAGREIERLRHRLGANAELRASLLARERDLRLGLDRLTESIAADEDTLGAHGGDGLRDDLLRMESMRERARATQTVVAERLRGLQRDLEAAAAGDSLTSLAAEAAQRRETLADVDAQIADLEPDLTRLGELEEALADDKAQLRRQFSEARAGDGDSAAGRAAEARGELGALQSSVRSGAEEAGRVGARIAELDERSGELQAAAEHKLSEITAADDDKAQSAASAEECEAAGLAAQQRVEAARERHSAAEAARHRWAARADALRLALDEARARNGVERLEGADGVLGTLLDLVDIEAGWEAAFEAAIGEALAAVVTDSAHAARRALAKLAADGAAGTVLALDASAVDAPGTGWAADASSGDNSAPGSAGGPGDGSGQGAGSPGSGASEGPASGERSMRRRVSGLVPGVDRLLDLLVGHVVVIDGGWPEAATQALADPAAVIVTRSGDRFSPAGWRVGGGSVGATGAALAEAETQLEAASAKLAECAESLKAAAADLAARQEQSAAAAARLRAAEAASQAARSQLGGIEADRRAADTEAETLTSRLQELQSRIDAEKTRISELEAEQPELIAAEAEAQETAKRHSEAQAELDERSAELAARRTQVEVAAAGLSERRALIVARLAEIDERHDRDAELQAEADESRSRLDAKAMVLGRIAESAAGRAARTERRIGWLRELKQRQSAEAQAITQRLADFRERLREAESGLDEMRSSQASAAVEQAELRTRLEGAVDRLSADHAMRPDEAVAAPCPELHEGIGPARRVEMIESEIDIIGPVNPLALEEYDELQERHTFLQGQIDDISATRRELQKVSNSISEEIASVFAATFADVSVNFSRLFETLFPGGEGSITLTDPTDLLGTGIEISARPSGKKIRKLSLLSGGERALTALAFLFAVFRSRPSPFYVMDEVEVALDDVNLHRFLALVEEFRSEAQLLLVSHQKRTMEIADCLYGVSMRSGDSSKLISSKTASAVA